MVESQLAEPTTTELYDVTDLARILKVSSRHIFRMLDAGQIPPPIRIGTKILRWDKEDILRWISNRCPNCRK